MAVAPAILCSLPESVSGIETWQTALVDPAKNLAFPIVNNQESPATRVDSFSTLKVAQPQVSKEQNLQNPYPYKAFGLSIFDYFVTSVSKSEDRSGFVAGEGNEKQADSIITKVNDETLLASNFVPTRKRRSHGSSLAPNSKQLDDVSFGNSWWCPPF